MSSQTKTFELLFLRLCAIEPKNPNKHASLQIVLYSEKCDDFNGENYKIISSNFYRKKANVENCI
jgi:hypothetical protein